MVDERRKILLLLKGHPGTGKSTLACSLARELAWPLIDKDDVRDLTVSLEEVPVCCPRGALNSLSYEVMWRIAERQLSLGLSVVVDCPLARPTLFQTATAIAARQAALACVIECRPGDTDEWRRRLESRATSASTNPEANRSPTQHPLQSAPRKPETSGRTSTTPPSTPREDESHEKSHGNSHGSSHEEEGSSSLGPGARGWHKPRTWADMESILANYNGCYEYDVGSTPAIVLDTTELNGEKALSQALEWVRTLRCKES